MEEDINKVACWADTVGKNSNKGGSHLTSKHYISGVSVDMVVSVGDTNQQRRNEILATPFIF